VRRPKVYTQPAKRIYRAELITCLSCGAHLRRYAPLSQRTIITLDGPIYLTHCGYRCPNAECPTHLRSYRSAAADALALPGFTFGLDIVVLIGQLRLAQQHSLDQAHQAVLTRLAPFELTISRREVLYLFDAYCTLMRAAQEIATESWATSVCSSWGPVYSIHSAADLYMASACGLACGTTTAAAAVGHCNIPLLNAVYDDIFGEQMQLSGKFYRAEESHEVFQAALNHLPW
jgi:hypothetical protein